MSSYPLETVRAAHEDIERSERLAAAALRERELQQLRHRMRKRAASSRIWDGVQMRDLAEEEKEVSPAEEQRARLFFSFDESTEDAKPEEADYVIETQRDGEEIARRLVELIGQRAKRLRHLYKAEALRDEKEKLSGRGNPEESISLFYQRLREVKEEFRQSSDGEADGVAPIGFPADRAFLESLGPRSSFSGEEAYGKYLDLHEHFQLYNNMHASEKRVDYVGYLTAISELRSLPAEVRKKSEYHKYCENLFAYLCDFAKRVAPLRVLEEDLRSVADAALASVAGSERQGADFTKYSTAEELEKNESAEILKETLRAMGLKCGGRPIERARRLLQVLKKQDESEAPVVLVLEAKILFLLDRVLPDHLKATKVNAEKKLTLSYTELEAERIAELDPVTAAGEAFNEEEDSDEEKPIYNPKDVPLGWDGKPIPYWQYKLHGLNHEFKCEVCGNATYRGPRAYERHFAEARHAYGLRCLGIQYTKDYFMVTRIEEVQALHAKLGSAKTQQFNPRFDAEFEDEHGNVFNSKTYSDMARQGLLQ